MKRMQRLNKAAFPVLSVLRKHRRHDTNVRRRTEASTTAPNSLVLAHYEQVFALALIRAANDVTRTSFDTLFSFSSNITEAGT